MSDIFERIARLPPEQQQILIQRLKNERKKEGGIQRRAPDMELAPLSYAQERFWLLSQLDPNNSSYNVHGVLQLTGPLDLRVLRRSLNEVVRRHDVLRTRFPLKEGKVVQFVEPEVDVPLPVIDMQHLVEADREAEVYNIAYRHSFGSLNLAQDFLVRTQVLRLSSDKHVFLFAAHHIIFDAWSIGVLVREIAVIYEAFVQQQPSPLRPLSFQYADYSVWQRELLAGQRAEKLIGYWQEKLAYAPLRVSLPFDYRRSDQPSFQGVRMSFSWPMTLRKRLKGLGQQEQSTLFMVLLALFALLLYRYSGQDDIVIGSPVAGRNRAEIEGILGCFINTLMLRTSLAGNPTFRELLRQVRQTCLQAYEHQDLPIEKLVDLLPIDRTSKQSAFFQILFAFQNAPNPMLQFSNLEVKTLDSYNTSTNFDLGLECYETTEGLGGSFEHMTDIFASETIEQMSKHFRRLAESIATDPDQHVLDIMLLSIDERARLLAEWNRTQRDYSSRHLLLHELIEKWAVQIPDAVALRYEEASVTYEELNDRSHRLAYYLQKQGMGPDVCVGVCMYRSVEMVIGLLGILKAGGAYLPLDPEFPDERLTFIIQDAGVTLLLTQEALGSRLRMQNVRVLCLDSIVDPTEGEEMPSFSCGATPENLAYVIYTSGSTGNPKGAMNTHCGICNRLEWMQEAYPLVGSDRILQKTPYSFDVSVWEFFWPLITGASIVLSQPGGHQDPAYLARLIIEQGVTVAHFVPSMLQIFLEVASVQKCVSLHHVICSGEVLPFSLQKRFFEQLQAELHNLYGPTEAAIDVTAWTCTRDDEHPSVAIGYPIANTQIYVLNPSLQPVPIGVIGEIFIGGVGLARGYRNQPALTAASFIPNPFSPIPGERLYRTKDVGRYREDGSIDFIGRVDYQVKIRGVRIDPGEIEVVLERHEAVKRVIVTVYERPARIGDKWLVAYVVLREQSAVSVGDLQAFLRTKLPEVMVPPFLQILEALPLLPNGKVDRRALPGFDFDAPKESQPFIESDTIVGITLSIIWAQILQQQRVGKFDNFFELGGNSLAAASLVLRISEIFHLDLPLQIIFDAPTLTLLAQAIEKRVQGQLVANISQETDIDFAAEAHLPEEIIAGTLPDSEESKPTNLFLTGATGFVGAFLLRELLDKTRATIYCLVRCVDCASGYAYLCRVLNTYALWDEQLSHRITIVPGDLSIERLGLSKEEFAKLADSIDAIYHAGAWVNSLYPYRALKAANVLGTQEILRLSSLHIQRPVHYVSTLSVFSAHELSHHIVTEDDIPSDIERISDGYSQSKWVAEQLVKSARNRGLPVSMYRLGAVSGHSQTGASNTSDFICRMIKGCVQLGHVPTNQNTFSLVPVDYIVKAIVYLSEQKDCHNYTFHLFNPSSISWNVINEWLNASGYSLPEIPFSAWKRALVEAALKDPASEIGSLLSLLPAEQPSRKTAIMAYGSGLDAPITRACLAQASLSCPDIDVELIRKYLTYLVKSGFLPAPGGHNVE